MGVGNSSWWGECCSTSVGGHRDVVQDCLFGMDFLGKHNCKIDLNGKSIKIGNEVVSLKTNKLSSKFFQ